MRWLISGLGLLFVALSACGGITTRLCGAPGQPCCAQATCDEGALCGAGELCEACGGEGQQCCAEASCAAPLVCTSNACVQPLTCQVSCTLGTSRCANNGVEQCVAAGVCPEWRALALCPSGAPCVVTGATADCQETCPGACTPGSLLCTSNGLQRCDAQGVCPALVSVADDPDGPACLTGAVITPELSWESPTPLGATLVDIAGELPGSYWVLDELGNVVRYALGPWEYELRPTEGKRMKKLASCGQGSRLYAVGEAGTVFRRAAAMWTEESVGSTEDLVDVACDLSGAYALSASGRLFVRGSAGWTAYETGVTGAFNALTTNFAYSELYLAGKGGKVVRCSTLALPPTCVEEPTPVTSNLRALWADGNTNTVWAVGDDGTLLQKGFDWQKIDLTGLTEPLVDITGTFDGLLPTIVVLSSEGTVIVRRGNELKELLQLPDTGTTAAWLPDVNTMVFTGQVGALWFRPGLNSTVPFVPRGGRRPLTASLHAVTSVGQGRLFAVGEGGARVRRQNGAWAVDQLGASTTATLRGVAARSAGEVYAVGDLGTVLVRRWGTWVAEAEGLTTEDLVGVALDTKKVWALGRTVLLEKDLATGAWRTLALPAGTPTLSALALQKDALGVGTELVLAGVDCALLSFEPSTAAFSTSAQCGPRTFDFLSATFTSAGELLLGSSEGSVHRRTGATLTLENVTGLRLEPWFGLVPDGSSVWAVGTDGALYRRVSGNWTNAAPDVTHLTLRAGVKDDDGLFVVGTGGVVLRRQ